MKRIESIDFTKGIGINAITLGHILIRFNNRNQVYLWVYSFEIPLFFIVSGILQSKMNLNQGSLNTYIKKQLRSIIYPYLMFSLVLVLLHICENMLTSRNIIKAFLRDCLVTISGMGVGALWFLPTLFFANISVNKIVRQAKSGGGSILCLTICLIVFASFTSFIVEKFQFFHDSSSENYSVICNFIWEYCSSISRIIVAISYILMGYLIGKAQTATRYETGRYTLLALSILLLALGWICAVSLGSIIDIHYSLLRNPVLSYISGFSSVFAILIIGDSIQGTGISKLFRWFGKNSLIIMFCQPTVLHYSCIFIRSIIDRTGIENGKLIVGTFIIIILEEVITVTLIRRYAIFRWLVQIPIRNRR